MAEILKTKAEANTSALSLFRSESPINRIVELGKEVYAILFYSEMLK